MSEKEKKELDKALEEKKKRSKAARYTDEYKKAVDETFRYANMSSKNLQEVADTLATGMTKRKPGDLGTWDWDVMKQTVKDQASATKAARKYGLFDREQYAVNPGTVAMVSDDYLKALAENLPGRITMAQEADAQAQKRKEQTAETQARWAELFKAKDTENEFDQWYNYLMADYLLGDRNELFDFEKINAKYDAMDDATYYAEEKRLKDQFDNLDWTALTGSSTNPHEGMQSIYQEWQDFVTKTIKNRERLNELQSSIRQNADFESMSQYTGQSLREGAFSNVHKFNRDDAAFVNDLYRFINSNMTHEQKQIAWEQETNVDVYLAEGYDMLTQDELADYNYLYNTGRMDEAAEYLELLRDDLLVRRANVNQAYIEAYSTADAGHATAAFINATANQAATMFMEPFQMYETAQGRDHPYSSFYDANNTVDWTAQTQLGAIESSNMADWVKGVASFAYKGVKGAADNGVRLLLACGNPTVALIGAGLSSASSSLHESSWRDDMSAAAKIVKAIGTGALEMGTEKIGLDKLFDMGHAKALDYIKTLLASELGEETINYLSEDVLEMAVGFLFDYEPQIKSGEEFWQGLTETWITTAISSGMMGAPGAMSIRGRNVKSGKTITSNGSVEQLLSIAESMGETSKAAETAKEIRKKTAGGKKASIPQLGMLSFQLEQELTEEQSAITNQVMEDAIEERMVELGSDRNTAIKNKAAVRKIAFGQELNAIEKARVQWDQNASQVVKELAKPIAEGEEMRTGAAWQTKAAIKNALQTRDVTQKQIDLASAFAKEQSPDVQAAKEKAKQKTAGKADYKAKGSTSKEVTFSESGEEDKGNFLRFKKTNDGMQAVVETESGETTIEIDDMKTEGGYGTATIIEYVSSAKHNMSEAEANTLMTAYNKQGGDAGNFIDSFEEVYSAGFAGIEAQRGLLQDDVQQAVYAQAKKEGEEAEANRVAKAQRVRDAAEGTVAWLGVVKDNHDIRGTGDQEALSGALEGMTESQRTTVEVVQAFAREMKVNMVLYESDAENVQQIANGMYDPTTHTVYLDINSNAVTDEGIRKGKETNTIGYAMMMTLGHELTHHMEATSAEGYARYKAAVKERLKGNGQSWTELVREKIKNASKEGRKLTRMGAEAEVVADASEYMLQDSAFTKRLDTGLKQKVQHFVQGFVEKVKEIFRTLGIGRSHREAAALREMADGLMKYTANLQELWDAGMEETIPTGNGTAMAKEQQTEVEAGELSDGNTQFSIRDQQDEGTKRQSVTETDAFKRWFGKSKIVNADGTPKIVYHQTAADFSVFNTDHPVAGQNDSETPNGIFFKENDHDIGIGGSKQMAVYLRAENILTFANRTEANAWYRKHVPGYDKLQSELDKKIAEFQPQFKEIEDEMFNQNTSDERYEELSDIEDELIAKMGEVENKLRGQQRELLNDFFLSGESGYDGIELAYDGHRWVNGNKENVHTYIVFSPKQIKSATDNVGTFDPETADIRYSTRDQADEETMRQSVTETDAFKRWFGDSEVVDDDSNPKAVYHTTKAEFNAFDPDRIGEVTEKNASDNWIAATAHLGFWFNEKGLEKKMGGKSKPYYLKAKRLYEAGTLEGLTNDIWDTYLRYGYDKPGEEPTIEMAREAGKLFRDEIQEWYDGIVVNDEEFGGLSYVVFEPNQIKSADEITYDDEGKEIPAEKRFRDDTNDYRFTTRDQTDAVSVREYLAEMTPKSYMNDTEVELLKRYQGKLKELQEKQRAVAEQEEIIKTATGEELMKATNRRNVLRNQADRLAKTVAGMESAKGFAGIMTTSRKVVDEYLNNLMDDVSDKHDSLVQEINGLTEQLKDVDKKVEAAAQGQRNAVARGLFDQEKLKQAAKKVKADNASSMSAKVIADRLALAYAELYAKDGQQGAKKFAEQLKDLAQDIISTSGYRYRSATLQMIAEEIPVISLTETDKQEIRNAGLTVAQYKRALSPYVRVTDRGSDLGSQAGSAEYYGGVSVTALLGTDNETDMAMALYDTIQREKAGEGAGKFEGMTEAESIGVLMAELASADMPTTQNAQAMEYLRNEMQKYAGQNETAKQMVEEALKRAQRTAARASGMWVAAVRNSELTSKAVDYYRELERQRRLMELREQKQRLEKELTSDTAKQIREKVLAQKQEANEYWSAKVNANTMRDRIARNVKRLNRLRKNETDRDHVPQELQHVTDMVMKTFTEGNLAHFAFEPAQTAMLQKYYRQMLNQENDYSYYWDDEIAQSIDEMQQLSEEYAQQGIRTARSTEKYEMERQILARANDIIENVLYMIENHNRQFINGKKVNFDQFAEASARQMNERKDKVVLADELGEAQKAVDELIKTGNKTPIYFFEQLENDGVMQIYNDIREGVTKCAHIVHDAKAEVEVIKRKHHYGRWMDDGKLTLTTVQGHRIKLTREQALWLYATAKRERTNVLTKTEHLKVGGFHYKQALKDGIVRQTDISHLMDAKDIAAVESWLTEEQKAYADEVVEYLSTTMGGYGNQASMEMFGYKKFNEPYYFPFQTAQMNRYLHGDEGAGGQDSGTGRVKNASYTKKLQRGAKTALVMDDFTTVAVDHMQSMAAYASMVEPIEALKRLLNFQVLREDGSIQTYRELIAQKYGKTTLDYLMNFLKDLNGAAQSDNRAMKGVDYFIRAFKRGAVSMSASVTLQQPTAIARAMAMVNPKYFLNNPFYRPGKGVWDEMLAHSGTAIIKDMGKFDVGLGMTASEYIRGEDETALQAWGKLWNQRKGRNAGDTWAQIKKAGKLTMDKANALPGLADQWTWGLIWQAVKKETAAMNPGMDTASNEFLDMVGKRFDDVIDHTQVYDSILTKSDLMRSRNALHKMATTFMAEPTMSINMLYDAFRGKHTAKERAAMVGGVMASNILAGLAAALVQAWNNDDDERNWAEKYADRAAGNVLGNINPGNMIPYIRDIISLCEGYDVERADMTVISDLVKYTSKFMSKVQEGKELTSKDWENFAGTWANLIGVPVKNIMREIRRGKNLLYNTDWSAPDASNVGYAMAENLPGYDSKNTAYYERIVTAMVKGDEDKTESLRTYMLTSKGVSEDALKTGIKNEIKARVVEGEMDEETALAFIVDNELMKDENEAYFEVDKWVKAYENGGKPNDYKKYDDFRDAVESGEHLKEVIDDYLAHGVTESTLTSELRGMVIDGLVEDEKALKILVDYGLKEDKNDAYWTVKSWKFAKETGKSTEEYRKYDEFYAALESGENLKAVIKEYTSHGVTEKTLADSIKRNYKEQMKELYRTNRTAYANLQARILTAYQVLGYDREKKLKDIQKWMTE